MSKRVERLVGVAIILMCSLILNVALVATHAHAQDAVKTNNVTITEQSLNAAMLRIDSTIASITGIMRGGQQRGLTRDEVNGLQNDMRVISAALSSFIEEKKNAAKQPSEEPKTPAAVEAPATPEAAPKS